LNVDAKPSVPVLEWSIQLKGSDTNLVDFDSEGNLLVFHDGDYSLHELLTFFTPDGDIIRNRSRETIFTDEDYYQCCINGSDWVFIVEPYSSSGNFWVKARAFDTYFNYSYTYFTIDNFTASENMQLDPYCLSSDNHLYLLNYFFFYNITGLRWEPTGDVLLQKFKYEVVWKTVGDTTLYDLQYHQLWNVSFLPEGDVIKILKENDNLLIGTTNNLYLLNPLNGQVKKQVSFGKTIDTYNFLDEGVLVSYWDVLPRNSSYFFEYYNLNGKRQWREKLPLNYEVQRFWEIETEGKFFIFVKTEGFDDDDSHYYGTYVYNSKGVLQTLIYYDRSTYTDGIFYYADIRPSFDNSFYCALNNHSSETSYTLLKYSFTEVKGIDGFSTLSVLISVLMIISITRFRKRKKYRN